MTTTAAAGPSPGKPSDESKGRAWGLWRRRVCRRLCRRLTFRNRTRSSLESRSPFAARPEDGVGRPRAILLRLPARQYAEQMARSRGTTVRANRAARKAGRRAVARNASCSACQELMASRRVEKVASRVALGSCPRVGRSVCLEIRVRQLVLLGFLGSLESIQIQESICVCVSCIMQGAIARADIAQLPLAASPVGTLGGR